MTSATATDGDMIVDTQHGDVVHDSQFDYYGIYLATCSSDRTVHIYSLTSNPPVLSASLTGHEGPVWMVAWAHPKFGAALASASFDGKAIVWKSASNGVWQPSTIITAHNASVNAVAWAPHETGTAAVATAGSDGNIFITSSAGGASWRKPAQIGADAKGTVHPMGVLGISFAPMASAEENPLLASCGCDGSVKVWRSAAAGQVTADWSLTATLRDHNDWVRDVAFSPDAGSAYYVLASCSQDKSVIVRRIKRDAVGAAGATWESSKPVVFAEPVFRLSWNPSGTSLLVTTGDSNAFLLSQGPTFADEWVRAPVSGADGDLKPSA